MWHIIAATSRLIPPDKAARLIAFPVALVVGTLGYILESKYRSPPLDIPYLSKPLSEDRLSRQLAEVSAPDFLSDMKRVSV